MPVVFLTHENKDSFINRFNAITLDSAPQWGSLNASGMLRHLRYTIELSLGEVQEKDISNFFSRTIIRILFFHCITTWPKGIKAPPTFTPDTSESLESEREQLIQALHRFCDTVEREPQRKTLSPLLGMITLRYWSRVHGIHMNHHLRQFGV